MRKIKLFLCTIMTAVSFISCNDDKKIEVTPYDDKKLQNSVVQNIAVPSESYVGKIYYTTPDNITIREVMGVSEENIIFNGYIESGFDNFEALSYGEKSSDFPVSILDNSVIDVINAGNNYLIVSEISGNKEMVLKDQNGNIISSTELDYTYKKAKILLDGRVVVLYSDVIKIYNKNLECEKSIRQSEFSDDGWIYDICTDSKGRIYCLIWNKINKSGSVCVINNSGEVNVIGNDLSDLGDNVTNIFMNDEDNLVVCGFDNNICLMDIIDVGTGNVLKLDEIEDVSEVYGSTSQYDLIYSNVKGIYGYNVDSGTSQNLILSDRYTDKEIFDILIHEDYISLIVGTYTNYEMNIVVSDYNGNVIQKYPSYDQLLFTNKDNIVYYIEEEYDYKTIEGIYISKAGADVSAENRRIFEINGINDDAFLCGIAVDNEEKFFVFVEDNGYYLYVYNVKGELIHNSKIDVNDYIRQFVYDKDKNIIAIGDKGAYKINNDFTLSDIGFTNSSFRCASAYDKYDLLYWSDTALYGYSCDTKQSEGILLWNDIMIDDMDYLHIDSLCTDNGGIYYNNQISQTVYKAEKNKNENNLKQIKLSLSAFPNMEERVKKAVRSFNNENSDYHIQIIDYSFEKTGTDNVASAIVQGDIPDIMMINTYDSIMSYLCKDAFSDINELIENDSEFTADSFYKNVLDAFKFKNKLYCIPVIYSFNTIVSNSIEEPSQFYNQVSENTDMMLVNTNGESMAENLLYSYIIENVDFEELKCNFDTEEFINLLKFIKEYVPHEASEDDLPEELYDESVAFADTFYVSDISSNIDQYVSGTDICGYPSFKGYINPEAAFVISEKSQYKEIAWEFVKYFMNYCAEIENNVIIGNHISQSHNEQLIAIKEKELEKQGFSSFTDEEKDRYNKLFDGVWKSKGAYIDIYNILAGECFDYFENDISAEEIASSLQSKISLYMSEIK